jgi:hypothetical protein
MIPKANIVIKNVRTRARIGASQAIPIRAKANKIINPSQI